MSELINNQELRIRSLKEVILHLHNGEAPEAVRGQLKSLVAEVDPSEIAAMEQQLMADGLSPEQVRAMCDLHADVLREVMAEPKAASPLQPGHPVDTFQRENRALEAAIGIARLRIKGVAALPDQGTPRADRLSLLEAANPPKSMAIVDQILADFKPGRRPVPHLHPQAPLVPISVGEAAVSTAPTEIGT